MAPRLLGSCALRERDIVYSVAAAGNATVAAGTSFGDIKVLRNPLGPTVYHLVDAPDVQRLQAVSFAAVPGFMTIADAHAEVAVVPLQLLPLGAASAGNAGNKQRPGPIASLRAADIWCV